MTQFFKKRGKRPEQTLHKRYKMVNEHMIKAERVKTCLVFKE